MSRRDVLTQKQKDCLDYWANQCCSLAGWGHTDEGYFEYIKYGGLVICCPEFMTDKEITEYERLNKIYGRNDSEDTGELDEKICEEMFGWET